MTITSVRSGTFIADIVNLIRDKLKTNITAVSSRVYTSYPQRDVIYPMITVVDTGTTQEGKLGMGSEGTALRLGIEIRIWGRNVKERDEIFKIVIGQTYYQRKEERFADLCEEFGLVYIDFFSENFQTLSSRKGYSLHNLGFKYLAIVLAEREKFDQAAEICQKAISYNLTDKTKTGYDHCRGIWPYTF